MTNKMLWYKKVTTMGMAVGEGMALTSCLTLGKSLSLITLINSYVCDGQRPLFGRGGQGPEGRQGHWRVPKIGALMWENLLAVMVRGKSLDQEGGLVGWVMCF